MSNNPLLPGTSDGDGPTDRGSSYVLPRNTSYLAPLSDTGRDAAAEVIRKKLEKIYANEPDAQEEIQEVKTVRPRSKHQEYMHELASSGRSLAEIQTAWHHYYVTLPDDEKHQVWQEFYESNAQASQYHNHPATKQPAPVQPAVAVTERPAHPEVIEKVLEEKGIVATDTPKLLAVHAAPKKRKPAADPKTIKGKIINRVTLDGQLKAKHHLQSLAFGLGIGMVVIIILLFGFFNDFILAPFIQPSRHASATPIILSTDSVAPTSQPMVIIPKINLEIPVDYSQTSTDENVIENALENGIVHYPTTSLPGQKGNAAFFGHSSNNILNKGNYKFAFVQLHLMMPGDTFYLTYQGKVYVYKVITKTVVDPSQVEVLNPVAGQVATATLITCDPPGTSWHRLVVVGQQITPDPNSNTDAPASQAVSSTPSNKSQLPGNGPTLFSRLWHDIF